MSSSFTFTQHNGIQFELPLQTNRSFILVLGFAPNAKLAV